MGGLDTELTPEPEENTKVEFFVKGENGSSSANHANEWEADMEDAAQHEKFD